MKQEIPKSLTLPESVIRQAWQDAFELVLIDRKTPEEVEEAWKFLTAQYGEWKRARDFWCCLCGKDESRLQAQALGMVEQHNQVRRAVVAYHERYLSGKRRKYRDEVATRQAAA